MFKIKLKDPSAGLSKEKGKDEKKKSLPKIKIARPQPPPTASSSSSSKPKSKAKHIKLKLKTAGAGISQPVVKKVPRIRVKPTRIPGDGYDSEASDIEDDPLVEEAIVLRLLPDAELDYVRHCVETGDFSNFHIKWKDRLRAVIYVNDSMYAARLVNLPNIVEVQKTVDKKNIFKTVDISQILQVVSKIRSEDEIENLQVEKDEMISDGLTPPLHNVTKSKYRRKMTNDYIEKIESKVDELLRLDEEAEESQFELIDPESLNVATSETPPTVVHTPSRDVSVPKTQDSSSTTVVNSSGKEHDEDLELEIEQVLGEDFSLEDGETVEVERQNGEKIQVEKAQIEEDEEMEEEEEIEEEEEEEDEESDEEDDDEEDDNSDNEQGASRKVEIDEDAQHNALLRDEINELLTTIEQNKSRLEKTSNQLLQSRFIDSINKLEKELENKKRQLKTSEDKSNSKKEQENGDDQDQDGDQEMDDRGDDREEEDEEDEDEEDEGDNDDDDLDELFG